MARTQEPAKPLRLAVLASGAGTTLQAVIDAAESGELDARVVVVISNNSGSGAIERAKRHGIPVRHLSASTHPDPVKLDGAIAKAIADHRPDLVLLAGYMKKLGAHALRAYRGRIVNTHPALLPRHGGRGLYGKHVHEAVIAAGERTTGVSVHLVDEGYDTGPVIAQCEVPVEKHDDAATLAARVQAAERRFLVEVLQDIADRTIALP
jgi:phosphoribosylglycinamide formyltransferase-1